MKYLLTLVIAASMTACATASKDKNSTRFNVADTTKSSGLVVPETDSKLR